MYFFSQARSTRKQRKRPWTYSRHVNGQFSWTGKDGNADTGISTGIPDENIIIFLTYAVAGKSSGCCRFG